jgi:hypothetical protein
LTFLHGIYISDKPQELSDGTYTAALGLALSDEHLPGVSRSGNQINKMMLQGLDNWVNKDLGELQPAPNTAKG